MHFVQVYDIANDSIGIYTPLFGLGLVLVGMVLRWGLGRSGADFYLLVGAGIFVILAAGAVPLWDYHRIQSAAARGEALQVEGPVVGWHIRRTGRVRARIGSGFAYTYHEIFSVGGVDFDVEWGALEAGFSNRGSRKGEPMIRLANAVARIRYLPVSTLNKTPRIVRLELAPGAAGNAAAGAAVAALPTESRITDDAGVLSPEQKEQIAFRIASFEQMTGHQLAVVTMPSLGGKDIARHAAALLQERGGKEDSILLLVVPGDRQARIAVGRGLETVLSDADCQEIMELSMTPLFRRGEIAIGIEAGVATIVGKVMSQSRPHAGR